MSEIEIFKRTLAYVGSEPFERDLFQRAPLANQLTGYVNRLKDGCVIAIDASWGDGKSWFGRNWHALLSKNNYPTVYLDAFENDFADDPFVVIASELVAMAETIRDDNAKTALIDKAKSVGKRILPLSAKIAVNVAGKLIGAEATEELRNALEEVPDDIGKEVEKYIAKRLEDHELRRRSIQGFRETVEAFSTKQNRPVVFFIDELDRCKPTFAVQMIERIKHFFDVPNIVFVLLLNRRQLESAIKGIYGEKVDANAYLAKFVHFTLTLPKKADPSSNSDFGRIYLNYLAKHHGYPKTDVIQNFVDVVAHFASWLELSLRDLERCFILFGLSQPIKNSAPFVGYLIALKLGRPEIFAQLAKDLKDGHAAALSLLDSLKGKDDLWIIPLLKSLHLAHRNNFKALGQEDQNNFLTIQQGVGMEPRNLIQSIIKKIDIQITG